VIAVLAAMAASCGGGGTDGASRPTGEPTVVSAAAATTEAPVSPTPVEPSPPETEAPATSAAPVPEALDFTAAVVGGGEFSGADLAGEDIVFWFWAPWCPTCAAAAGDVLAARESYPGVTFVGVGGLSSDAGSMERFVADHGIDGFDQIADVDGDVYTRFGVVQQHTFAFVSADGDVETVPAYGLDVDVTALVGEMFG
jgi:peroxiredoxin